MRGASGGPDADSLVLFDGPTCYVMLNRYPYTSGHLMVVPNRHVGALAALTRDEMNEIGQRAQECEVVLTEAYQPHGFNVGVNLGAPAGAGIRDHLHLHVVPRWTGDANFMTVVSDTRVLPEDLRDSAARLRPIFARVSGAHAP